MCMLSPNSWEHLEIVLATSTIAQTRDLELRQTSRDCAELFELVLPKLKMILA